VSSVHSVPAECHRFVSNAGGRHFRERLGDCHVSHEIRDIVSALSRLTCVVLLAIITACAPAPLEPFAATEYGYFQSGSIRLYYAFDLPEGVERPPLIVLSHGSGRENTAHNARFALPLVQRGFAVLRFDKRGVGKSGGEYSKASGHMTLQAGDLVAAVDFARADPRIDASRIGLMGQSQAGWVVPEAAVRSPDVSFVILTSGPTVTIQQVTFIAESAGVAACGVSMSSSRLSGLIACSSTARYLVNRWIGMAANSFG